MGPNQGNARNRLGGTEKSPLVAGVDEAEAVAPGGSNRREFILAFFATASTVVGGGADATAQQRRDGDRNGAVLNPPPLKPRGARVPAEELALVRPFIRLDRKGEFIPSGLKQIVQGVWWNENAQAVVLKNPPLKREYWVFGVPTRGQSFHYKDACHDVLLASCIAEGIDALEKKLGYTPKNVGVTVFTQGRRCTQGVVPADSFREGVRYIQQQQFKDGENVHDPKRDANQERGSFSYCRYSNAAWNVCCEKHPSVIWATQTSDGFIEVPSKPALSATGTWQINLQSKKYEVGPDQKKIGINPIEPIIFICAEAPADAVSSLPMMPKSRSKQ
jgi:hypothetical protein